MLTVQRLVKDKTNVIIRNIAISKVLAGNGDAIGIRKPPSFSPPRAPSNTTTAEKSTNVWVDHVDVSSDTTHTKDYYDGLIDITHAADFITVSNSYIHDHWKASLIGHSDSNGAEDTGHLRVTQHNNHWHNINSRAPSLRFGTGHVFNSFFSNVSDGINTRLGAQVLVQSNVWEGCKNALFSTDGGFAVQSGNDFGGAADTAPVGTIKSVPYSYALLGSANVKAAVVGSAGNTLSF